MQCPLFLCWSANIRTEVFTNDFYEQILGPAVGLLVLKWVVASMSIVTPYSTCLSWDSIYSYASGSGMIFNLSLISHGDKRRIGYCFVTLQARWLFYKTCQVALKTHWACYFHTGSSFCLDTLLQSTDNWIHDGGRVVIHSMIYFRRTFLHYRENSLYLTPFPRQFIHSTVECPLDIFRKFKPFPAHFQRFLLLGSYLIDRSTFQYHYDGTQH